MLKGVSKVVFKQEIKHDDYVHAIETNEALKKGRRAGQKLQPPTLHLQATTKNAEQRCMTNCK